MGCVLCKRIAGKIDCRRSSTRSDKKDGGRESEQRAVPAQDDVVGRGTEDPKKPSAPPSQVPEFRLGRRLSAGGDVWPAWLIEVAGPAIKEWKPRRANTFEKLDKIGSGTYSNVYKARDLISGKIVALKKVRFDSLEPETVRFMAREILVLRRLSHPNVIKLEGLVISRLSSSLYLVFEYKEHDLAGLAAVQTAKFTEPQVKCFIKQLLSGLEHCHDNNVLHRDIKCSNLLIDDEGVLSLADFGLASFFDPEGKKPMTSRVITLWYRPPELLLGATHYGVGVDLWSAGCILAELFAGKPILRGRTEIEQLHKIFKLCGSPSEEYWKKSKFPNATLYKPQHPYKRCVRETFKDFPPSALELVDVLLSIDPEARGTATSALNCQFFTTEPYACEPSSLPKFPPSKEMEIKLRDEEARRRRDLNGKSQVVDGNNRRSRLRDREKVSRAIPAPEANAELQANLDRMRIMFEAKAKSKSEKFPPPHRDGEVGHHHHHHHTFDAARDSQVSFVSSKQADSNSFYSAIFNPKLSRSLKHAISKKSMALRRKTAKEEQPHGAPSRSFVNELYPSIGWDFRLTRRKTTASENFSGRR